MNNSSLWAGTNELFFRVISSFHDIACITLKHSFLNFKNFSTLIARLLVLPLQHFVSSLECLQILQTSKLSHYQARFLLLLNSKAVPRRHTTAKADTQSRWQERISIKYKRAMSTITSIRSNHKPTSSLQWVCRLGGGVDRLWWASGKRGGWRRVKEMCSEEREKGKYLMDMCEDWLGQD